MREAVVMAAGEGSRLRPLTDRWPKPILPIDGQPVIGMLLRELAAAGVERAFVITGHLAEQVEALVGDGEAFGLEAVFVRQPGVLGSADTVRRALGAGARPPFLVTAADTLYTSGDVGRFAVSAAGFAGALAVRRDPPPDPSHRRPIRIEDGLVRRILDDDAGLPLSAAPLWAWGEALVPYLEDLPGPPFELATAAQRAIDDGMRVAGIEIGRTRDLTHPADVVVENFPYLVGVV